MQVDASVAQTQHPNAGRKLMQAITVRSLGDPDVLRLENSAQLHPAANGAVVQLRRAGVNFADTERRRGLYEHVALPWTPGTEGAGAVVELGVGADPAQFVAVPANRLMLVPDGLSDDLAAAFPMQGLTAYHALFTSGGSAAGETVLIHGAAGGVGLFAVQLARLAGARVLGVVSSAAKAGAVRDAGGEELLSGDGLESAIENATNGRGVDVVLDSVGRDMLKLNIAALAPFGRLILFGEPSGPAPAIVPGDLYERSLRVGAYWIWTPHLQSVRAAAVARLIQWLVEGSIRVHIDRVVPLAQAAEAPRDRSTANRGQGVIGNRLNHAVCLCQKR